MASSIARRRYCRPAAACAAALSERFGCDLSVKNFPVTELPAREQAIAMAQTETARIARPALAAWPVRWERRPVVYLEA
jgi:hypothetical protein